MPTLKVNVDGLSESDSALRRFGAALLDWRPYWRLLGERLATDSQQRWPLMRKSGRLRRSLAWAGGRLGRFGVYEASPDRLTFGTTVFYGRFHQHGAKHTPRRPLIHIDETQHAELLQTWLLARAARAGLEVT